MVDAEGEGQTTRVPDRYLVPSTSSRVRPSFHVAWMKVPDRVVTGVHEVQVAFALLPLRTTVTVAPSFPVITAVVPPAVRRIAPPPVESAEVVSEVVLTPLRRLTEITAVSATAS